MNTSTHNDNFTFFVDNITLEKSGVDEKGQQIMKIGGIASTSTEDTDGEMIDENGWDVDYFLNSGFFNYNHQAKFNPKAVVGEPTLAKVTPKGVYVEGFLYSDSELARSVYETTEMLRKSSSSRRMGFSIEGKALERDPFNPNRITKARLTGCALTLNPKNPNTLVDILKGEYHSNDEIEYNLDNIPTEVKERVQKIDQYILSIEREGRLIQVDKDLNVKISNSPKTESIDKSLSTTTHSEITVESVDQNVKNAEILPKTKKNLTKGEVYSEIFNYIYDGDLEKSELMYKIAEQVSIKRQEMEKGGKATNPEITRDDLVKSLDIIMGTSTDNLVKSEGDEQTVMTQEDIEKSLEQDEEYNKLKKACDMAMKALDDYKKGKIEKGELSGYPQKPAAKESTMQDDPHGSSIGKEGEFMNKGGYIQNNKIEKSEQGDDLVKAIESTLEKSLQSSLTPVSNHLQTLAKATKAIILKNEELEKSLESEREASTILRNSLDELGQEVKKIAETPMPSRSVTTDSYRRHPRLEKSEDGSTRLHVQANKSEILDLLDKKAGLDTDNPNMHYAQSMAAFESSGVLEKSIINDLQKSERVEIIGM